MKRSHPLSIFNRPAVHFRPTFLFFCAFAVLTFFAAGNAVGGDEGVKVEISPKDVRQGEAAFVRVSSSVPLRKVSAEWRGKTLPFYRQRGDSFASILGIDLEQETGKESLFVEAVTAKGNAVRSRVEFNVLKKDFPVQRLTLPSKMVDLSKKDLERVKREKEKVLTVLNAPPTERHWTGGFRFPLEGSVLSEFGLRRILNDQPRSPHSGIDLRAPLGTPVRASGAGVVVYTGNHFFSGKSVFIDHGMGIITMYFHLSKIEVKPGDQVKEGQTLGRAGKTGRATGSHLHWGVRILGSRVDPLSLLSLFE